MDSSNKINRRGVLKLAVGAVAAIVAAPAARVLAANENDGFIDVRRAPDSILIITETDTAEAKKSSNERWEAAGAQVRTAVDHDLLHVALVAPDTAIKKIRLSWKGSTSAWQSILGDHWERSYGDLRWREPDPARVAPWYLLIHTESGTHAIGVRTQPAAFCGWTCDADGVSLTCDLRSGGVGVMLGERELHVCDLSAPRGSKEESAFAAACAFCKMLCPKPRLADHPIYGANDWYYAYGNNTPAGLLADAELLAELTQGIANRPYCVIDDGWQIKQRVDAGQWSAARPKFGSMSDLAASMSKLGVRPGIWMRPLIDEIGAWPAQWHLNREPKILDPTLREVKQLIATDIKRLREWGYKLIKHDFSTYDILGRWGREMKAGAITADGWCFASRDKTNAEIITDLYRTIREAAGDTIIIGCNTVGHLCAGIFELNRIGDDTSGNEWRRNPQMGVNALAFRAPHHGNFYAADADCCPITRKLQWNRARQWLDLVARSGTALFVSVERAAVTPQIRQSLRDAFAAASINEPLAEPMDWMDTPTPREWKLGGKTVTYDWS